MTAVAVPQARRRQAPPSGWPNGPGVALFDRLPMFRDGVAALVTATSGMHWVGSATSHAAVIELCRWGRPDVLVIAAELDEDGDLCRTLLSRGVVTTVVYVIDPSPRAMSQAAHLVCSGATGVVSRSAEAHTFANALRATHRERRRFIDPALLSAAKHKEVRPADNPLSAREFEVLGQLARGLGNAEIALRLQLSVETVRTHVRRILRKLNATNRSHAVASALRRGLVASSLAGR